MSEADAATYHVEPLGDQHGRTAFICGVPDLDYYLRHQAGQDIKRKVAAAFVLLDPGGSVVGYYTLSAYGIRLTELPPHIAKKLPKYPLIPATLLGRLAISRAHHGQKLGRRLLMDGCIEAGKIPLKWRQRESSWRLLTMPRGISIYTMNS